MITLHDTNSKVEGEGLDHATDLSSQDKLCILCPNMDIESMVCEMGNVYDIASNLPGAAQLAYQLEGYRHNPSYASLLASSQAGCRICQAMVIEIRRYTTYDVISIWKDHLDFLDAPESQIYLHYPTSADWPGLGIFISCGLVDSMGKNSIDDWLEMEVPSAVDSDTGSIIDFGDGRPTAVIIGKIGVCFLPQTEEEKAAAAALDKADMRYMRSATKARPIARRDDEKDQKWRLKKPPLGMAIQEDPLSEDAVTRIKDWLSHCCQKHEHCTSKGQKCQMPTRLIDVGPSDASEEPRLILTSELEEDLLSYVALSHTWGGHVPFQTRTETLKQRLHQISLDDLPKSFKDAVVLSRRLHVRYLWIDSICIVQNDADDWAKEGDIMGAIYKNSFLTISATTARNSTEGFLHCRIPRFMPILADHQSESPYLNYRLVFRPWLLSWPQSVDSESRAWVLQERLLPPRTLHFGLEQMFWECRSALCPEGHWYEPINPHAGDLHNEVGEDWENNKVFLFPDGAEDDIDFLRRWRSRSSTYLLTKAVLILPAPIRYERRVDAIHPVSQTVEDKRWLRRLHLTWLSLVENYSRRKLTY
jgi:hypothetical protein